LPHLFQILRTILFRSIWSTCKAVTVLVHWTSFSPHLELEDAGSMCCKYPLLSSMQVEQKRQFSLGGLVGVSLACLEGLAHSCAIVWIDSPISSSIDYGAERAHPRGRVTKGEYRDAQALLQGLGWSFGRHLQQYDSQRFNCSLTIVVWCLQFSMLDGHQLMQRIDECTDFTLFGLSYFLTSCKFLPGLRCLREFHTRSIWPRVVSLIASTMFVVDQKLWSIFFGSVGLPWVASSFCRINI